MTVFSAFRNGMIIKVAKWQGVFFFFFLDEQLPKEQEDNCNWIYYTPNA